MLDLLEEDKINELIEYAQMYFDSISTNDDISEEMNAEERPGSR